MRIRILRALLLSVVLLGFDVFAGDDSRSAANLFREALRAERIDNDPDKAIALYQKVVASSGGMEKVMARALTQMAGCYEEKEQFQEAAGCYRKVVESCRSERLLVKNAESKLETLAPLLAAQTPKTQEKPEEKEEPKPAVKDFDKILARPAWDYISGRVEENYLKAGENRQKYSAKVYSMTEDNELCCGGMIVYKNDSTAKSAGDEISLGRFADADMLIISPGGAVLESQARFQSLSDNTHEIYAVTDIPIGPRESVCFGWQQPWVQELENKYDLYEASMKCDPAPDTLESVFLVVPGEMGVIDPNIAPTSCEQLDSLNVYEWTGGEGELQSEHFVLKIGKPGLQSLINKQSKGAEFVIPNGVYTEPIIISKPIKLRGESLEGCRFEVVSQESAIWVKRLDSDEEVTIENITFECTYEEVDLDSQKDRSEYGRITVRNVTWIFDDIYDTTEKQSAAIEASTGSVVIDKCLIKNMSDGKFASFGVLVRRACKADIGNLQVEGPFLVGICVNDIAKALVHDCFVTGSKQAGIGVFADADAEVQKNILVKSETYGLYCRGDNLIVRDNIVEENEEEGIRLGDECKGKVENNIIVKNCSGIHSSSGGWTEISHNVIGESSCGLFFASYCKLKVNDNIFFNNKTGLFFFSMSQSNYNKLGINTYWGNDQVHEGFKYITRRIENSKDDFVDSFYKIKEDCDAAKEDQGLTNTEVFEEILKRRNENGIKDHIISLSKGDV